MKTFALTAVMVFAAVSAAFAADGQLQMLIDRAAEREALFDGVEARFTFNAGGFGGMRGLQAGGFGAGGGARREEGQRPQQRQGGGRGQGARQEFQAPQGGISIETSSYWARSQNNVRIESSISGNLPFGGASPSIQYVTDGQTGKALVGVGEGYRGILTEQANSPARFVSVTPDNFVTSLPFTGASTLDLLEARSDEITMRGRGGRGGTVTIERETRLVGRETIDGQNCLVVEVVQTTGQGRRGGETVQRLYFGEDVNYAVVRFEQGRARGDEWIAQNVWTMGDFKEVKPGLFVPYSARGERRGRDGAMTEFARMRVDSLDFRLAFEEGFFDLVFPAGTEVRDNIADLSYFAGVPEGALDLVTYDAAIEEVSEGPVVEAAVAEPPAPLAQSAPAQGYLTPLFAAAAALAALLIGAAVIVIKRRKHA